MVSYKEMLVKCRKELPEKSVISVRFEIPKIRGHFQGNKTIMTSFNNITSILHRDPKHLLKYILKSLATPGEIKSSAVILGSKVSASKINERVEQYAKEYVICKDCMKPDTRIIKEGALSFLKCLACGAKHPVKGRI
jgi:translation initiation factor 2 subunit 2